MHLPDNKFLALLALFAPPALLVSLAWWLLGAHFFVVLGVASLWFSLQLPWSLHLKADRMDSDVNTDEEATFI